MHGPDSPRIPDQATYYAQEGPDLRLPRPIMLQHKINVRFSCCGHVCLQKEAHEQFFRVPGCLKVYAIHRSDASPPLSRRATDSHVCRRKFMNSFFLCLVAWKDTRSQPRDCKANVSCLRYRNASMTYQSVACLHRSQRGVGRTVSIN